MHQMTRFTLAAALTSVPAALTVQLIGTVAPCVPGRVCTAPSTGSVTVPPAVAVAVAVAPGTFTPPACICTVTSPAAVAVNTKFARISNVPAFRISMLPLLSLASRFVWMPVDPSGIFWFALSAVCVVLTATSMAAHLLQSSSRAAIEVAVAVTSVAWRICYVSSKAVQDVLCLCGVSNCT